MWFKFSLVAFIALFGSVSCFPESRVLNGTATDITKYPYVVSLRYENKHVCGATIIDSRHVLTAAHCVFIFPPNKLTVQYGSTIIDELSPNVVGVQRIWVHKKFSLLKLLVNDIAVLALDRPIVLNNKTTAAVKFPKPFFEVPQTIHDTPGYLTGWGLNATGGSKQSVLQEADLKMYSDKDCKSKYYITTPRQLCAGVDEGGKGQCFYDSGSPLTYNGLQVGIVNLSHKPKGCASPNYPGVYTKVSHYIDWIDEIVHLLN